MFHADDWTLKALAVPLALYQDGGHLKHSFDRLLLVHGDGVHEVWKRPDAVSDPRMDMSGGFPIYEISVLQTVITKGSNPSLVVGGDGADVAEVVTLDPMDKGFTLVRD